MTIQKHLSLWQYYTDEAFINDNRGIINVPHDPHNASFKYRQIKDQTGNEQKMFQWWYH